MVPHTLRFFAGTGPTHALTLQLADRESCFARFAHDPKSRLWVCGRVGDRIFSSSLPPEDARIPLGGGPLLIA